MVRKLIIGTAMSSAILFATASVAFADTSPNGPGQPSQNCQSLGSPTPGNSASSPGSPFNPNGQAGNVYAGNAPQNSNNPKSVSQYDVACFQQFSH